MIGCDLFMMNESKICCQIEYLANVHVEFWYSRKPNPKVCYLIWAGASIFKVP